MNMHASIDDAGLDRLEIVGSADRLAAIGEPWTRLWHAADALVFQSHGWIAAWWDTVKNRDEITLRVGLIWRGDKLLAVVPLAITRRKGLRFLEWAAGAHTDYGDILCAPECPDAALDRLWTSLWEAGGFDLALVNRLLPDTAAWRIFGSRKANGAALRPGHRQEVSSRIAGDWESGAAWLASRPRKARKNYRRSIKLLEEVGDMRIRLLDADEPLGPVLDRLAALKRKWLERTERRSELFDVETSALKALVDVLARAGTLHVFVIELDGVEAAISINFVQRNTMMAWVTTYDPEFARASPGMVLIFEYIQWSFDHGLDMVDLLCGGEAFKERFSTRVVALQSVVGARTAKGSLALMMGGIRQKFLKWRESKVIPVAEEAD